jgi:hypothetical protein
LNSTQKKNLTHISGFGNDLHFWLEALGAHPMVPIPLFVMAGHDENRKAVAEATREE